MGVLVFALHGEDSHPTQFSLSFTLNLNLHAYDPVQASSTNAVDRGLEGDGVVRLPTMCLLFITGCKAITYVYLTGGSLSLGVSSWESVFFNIKF